MISCSLPAMVRLYSRRLRLSAISMAPPPATIESFFTARRTIMMASCNERSTSSMNCSAPPRRIIVAVLARGQPVKMLYRSEPICISSRTSHVPNTCADWAALLASGRFSTVVIIAPPHAFCVRFRSSSWTRPAQNMSLEQHRIEIRVSKRCLPIREVLGGHITDG